MKGLPVAVLFALVVSGAHAQQQDPMPELEAAAAVASAASAAFESVTAEASAFEEVSARLQTGLASWYGKQFHGRKTASGEAFNMDALTAAHPKLPFGSWVRVRNLDNGQSVDVRINDRGPYVKRRIIDLSRAAARVLGLGETGAGTRPVEITLLEKRR